MTIVLTNDDGVDAPGLAALFQAVNSLSGLAIGGADDSVGSQSQQRIVIAAPLEQLSGCGHRVTTHEPIQVQQRSQDVYAIAGTPADCTRLVLSHLCPDVQLVLSGINAGGNLGADIYISGTVAAVREAALHRIPAVAISQYRDRGRAIDWGLSAQLAQEVLKSLLSQPLPAGAFWNVNLPHLQPGEPFPEIIICPLCRQPLPVSYRPEQDGFHYVGNYSDRQRDPGADVEICLAGQIAVTQLHI